MQLIRRVAHVVFRAYAYDFIVTLVLHSPLHLCQGRQHARDRGDGALLRQQHNGLMRLARYGGEIAGVVALEVDELLLVFVVGPRVGFAVREEDGIVAEGTRPALGVVVGISCVILGVVE